MEPPLIRQILLSLPTHPDSPPAQTLEGAAVLAQLLGARLTTQIPQLSGNPETWPPVIGTFPLSFPQMMNEAVVQSEKNAAIMTETLTDLCSQMRVSLDIRRSLATLYASPRPLVDLARLHDLTILPFPETDSFGRSYVEAAIFDTGRPTLLLPSGERTRSLQRLDTVVVAWDFSREAARAMADALPILMRANRVHILSVFGEKGIQTTCVSGDLEKYLTAHQVKYAIDQVSLDDCAIGECVMSHAAQVNADMLVMGAYGHSRFREFILGGATGSVLSDPRLPILLSH
jgi:nucleotide-binding universal stress UspA family protein